MFNPAISQNRPFHYPSTLLHQSCRQVSVINEQALRVFMYIRNSLWNLINPAWQMARRGIQITAEVIPRFSPKLLKVFSAMGLSACVSAIFTLSLYPSNVRTLLENVNLQDFEGVVISSLSLITSHLTILDSTISIANALTGLEVFPVISIFSMLGYVLVKGIYDSVHLKMMIDKLPCEVNNESIVELRKNLNHWLKTDTTHVDALSRAKQIHKLTRRADKKTVLLMKDLSEKLNKGSADINEINQTLSQIHQCLLRKAVVSTINAASSLCLGSLVAATYFLSVPTILISRWEKISTSKR